MIWTFIIFGGLTALGITMMYREATKMLDQLPRRLRDNQCVRCGRDSTNAWCPDCADHLDLVLP